MCDIQTNWNCIYEGESGVGASAGDTGAGRSQSCGTSSQRARGFGQTKVCHTNTLIYQYNIIIKGLTPNVSLK